MKVRALILACIIGNAVLYSMTLPLWEGFDEPFHFGYVQTLANGSGFPDPRTTHLSEEVGTSLVLAPASLSVQRNLPVVTSYPEFFSWPASKRLDAHRKLMQIDPGLRWNSSLFLNYEGLQAPLAYSVLAPVERIGGSLPIPRRVLLLRMIAGLSGGLLILLAAMRLLARLGVGGVYRGVALFCIFSSQMLWATIARVANDWLAVAVAAWLLVAALEYAEGPSLRRAAWLSLLLSGGLLTKSYFLAFVPLLPALCLLRRRWKDLLPALALMLAIAGPWYARNLQRYETLSGMQELRNGIDPSLALKDFRVQEIPSFIESCARGAIWTGNNSFRSFSTSTLRIYLGIWSICLALWALSRHRSSEWIVALYSGLFILALAYNSAINHVTSGGTVASPGAWYTQVLLVPALSLAFLGTTRAGRVGKVLAAAMMLISGYILVATYWFKLIPLYAGYADRMSFKFFWSTYAGGLPEVSERLGSVCSVNGTAVIFMAAAVTLVSVAAQTALLRRMLAPTGKPE